LDSLHKRKRSAFEDDVSLAKSHRYSLTVTPTFPSNKPRSAAAILSTPRLDTFVKPSTTPASAPAAGRSPTRKRSSDLLQPRRRFNPPSIAPLNSPSLSLSAALNGTKKSRTSSSRKPRNQTIETSKPKSWFFDIYEESEEMQDYRMNEWTMTQSATGLDISDDESKSKSSDRGKENVDPNEMPSAPVTRAMAAAATAIHEKEVEMSGKEEPRTPLGDLNPSKYYAEGLDATSVVLVHDDEEAETDVEGEAGDVAKKHHFTFQPPTSSLLSQTSRVMEDMHAPSLADILSSAAPNMFENKVVHGAVPPTILDNQLPDAEGDVDIEIWESQSAKDENENEKCEVPGSPRSVAGDENAFALQEL
jgi:hypothetical protein